MIMLTGYEGRLYRKVISLISQSGMTTDPEERMRLLEETSEVMEHIKRETNERKERESWKS